MTRTFCSQFSYGSGSPLMSLSSDVEAGDMASALGVVALSESSEARRAPLARWSMPPDSLRWSLPPNVEPSVLMVEEPKEVVAGNDGYATEAEEP